MHKAGFVNIIGNPNVGKSTLMNALVGERLSIITSKAQTTRHRILGVVSGEDFQIVFSDTPGILKPSYKLQESMMKFVTGAVNDADVILYVTDTVEQSDRSNDILEKIRQSDIPTLAVINKIDLTTPEKLEELVDKWQALLPAATIVPVSARENFNIKGLFDLILERLPEGEAFYSKDTLTDKTLRFFASEGKTYRIESSTDVTFANSNLVSTVGGLVGQGAYVLFNDLQRIEGNRFYRVVDAAQ